MEPTREPVVIRGTQLERRNRIERIYNRIQRTYPGRSERRLTRESIRRPISVSARKRMPGFRGSNIELPEISRFVKTFRRAVISVLILAFVFIFNSINTKFTNGLINSLKSVLSYNFEMEDVLGKLKFVESYLPDISEVFGTQNGRKESISFIAPVQGTIIAMYGDTTAFGGKLANEGIDILAEEKSDFFAASDGIIASVEDHRVFGKSLWIQHKDGYFTFYGGCDELSVSKGQRVKKGDKIGSVAVYKNDKSILHFEIWKDNKTVNPLEHVHAEEDVSKL